MRKKYNSLIQKIFIVASILLICALSFFYGERIFSNKKGNKQLINEVILIDNPNLKNNNGYHLFTGKSPNNYLQYNNLLFRITSINLDNTITLVLDDYINVLPFDNNNTDYNDSSLNAYLNNEFAKMISTSDLVISKTYICEINDLNNIDYSKVNNQLISLPDVTMFINSFDETGSFMANDYKIWLTNGNGQYNWHTNKDKISYSSKDNFYTIKPVITLKDSAIYLQGDGSKNNPYMIKETSPTLINKVVKLDNDLWVIYCQNNEEIRLIKVDSLPEKMSFGLMKQNFNPIDQENIGYYLNNDYFNSLSYKDLLLSTNWQIDNYDKDNNITTTSVECKVGLPALNDIKLIEATDYYQLTIKEKYPYVYSQDNLTYKPLLPFNINPCIVIDANCKFTGSGTYQDPYIISK